MSMLRPHDQKAAEALAAIPFTNPFLEERIALERSALGAGYHGIGPVLRARPGANEESFPALQALRDRSESLVATMRSRMEEDHPATPSELRLYEDLALFLLYLRSASQFEPLVKALTHGDEGTLKVTFWDEFKCQFNQLFRPLGRTLPSDYRPELIFAGLFQVERAFTHIFDKIIGGSMPAARLRAAVWESIFSCDMRRYLCVLHAGMADVPTLVVGPSGSGKELVARAIGMSGFIPFDAGAGAFKEGSELFAPVNLAALAPGLIESELFGHVKGSFAGAVSDRKGWLEKCGQFGAIFLDEIGELDGSIQVKLLRVLDLHRFERVGSTKTLCFAGKVIAATNRDLAAEMEAGKFRHDLYYRICADQVTTPSLAEQLADQPDDLPELVRFIARDTLIRSRAGMHASIRAADAAKEVERLTGQVVDWIGSELGPDYAWPGNFRELGQCVRNVMIRGRYHPPSRGGAAMGGRGPLDEFFRAAREVELTADQLLAHYYAMSLHCSKGSFRAAGRRVDRDWRVVRDQHDPSFLDQLRAYGNAQVR